MTPTLVLLPGMDGTGDLFDDFVAALPRGTAVRVGRYPAREFLGYSQLDAHVKALTKDLGQFVVLGESFSSILAIRLAATKPPNLAGLILCAGFASNPFPVMGRVMKVLARPWLFHFEAPGLVLNYYIYGPSTPASLKERIRQNLKKVSPEVLAGRAREIINCDARAELAQITIPMLYVRAANDRLIKARCFEEIRAVRPGIQLGLIPAPHLVLQSQPRWAAEIIMEFCSSISS